MKYFTKYLPVPGEIKEGDLTIRKSDGFLIHAQHDKSNTREYALAKLFLCSRDIQVGDKVQFQLTKNVPFRELLCIDVEPHQNTVVLRDEEFDYHTSPDSMNQCFRIIGECSPNAIWVKEGMEFDEDAIRLLYIANSTKASKDWYEKLVKFDPIMAETFSPYIEFKCPTCNTFH